MAKPVIRLGVDVDTPTWRTLLKVEAFEGVRTYDFLIDTSQPTVWLYLIAESEPVINRLHDVTTKNGGLPMKSAGEWRDSAEAYGRYFQAEVRAARLELRMHAAKGGPEADYLAAEQEYATAVRARDSEKQLFESAVKRDTKSVAELDEMMNREDASTDHLGPAN